MPDSFSIVAKVPPSLKLLRTGWNDAHAMTNATESRSGVSPLVSPFLFTNF